MLYGSRRDLGQPKMCGSGWSMKVWERQVTIRFEMWEAGGLLGGKGVAHVSPSRNFRVRSLFISCR
jgi:hypothetical protein